MKSYFLENYVLIGIKIYSLSIEPPEDLAGHMTIYIKTTFPIILHNPTYE